MELLRPLSNASLPVQAPAMRLARTLHYVVTESLRMVKSVMMEIQLAMIPVTPALLIQTCVEMDA